MGGIGSGGRNRKSDAEKKTLGTYRSNTSEEVYNQRAAEKVIAGPWLTRVEEPSLPLNEIGRAKYFEFANLLLNGNKLTRVTCDDCERYALMHQQMHEAMKAGKRVPMDLIKRMDSIAVRLRIAEDAPPIANPNQKSRFAGAGFSNHRTSPFRLRSTAS